MNDNKLGFITSSFLYCLSEMSQKIKEKIEQELDSDQIEIINRAYKIASSVNGSSGTILANKITECSSVFNILNGNNQNKVYDPKPLDEEPNYPCDKNDIDPNEQLSRTINKLEKLLCSNKPLDQNTLDNMLWLCSSELTCLAPDTESNSLKDISLYDLMKMTCAFSLCMFTCNEKKDNSISDDNKAFLIYSIDISGIQSFIYRINSKGALKGLRARSFYLEILFEYVIDYIIEKLELCRCNVLYVGGGHTYLILPNTAETLDTISNAVTKLNDDLMTFFDNSLYAVSGYSQCSANDLRNIPNGAYSDIFARLSEMLSSRKMSKYNCNDIRKLNSNKKKDHSRECIICKQLTDVNNKGVCNLCSSLEALSESIKSREEVFAVVDADMEATGLDLPFEKKLISVTKQQAVSLKKNGQSYFIYSKNQTYTEDSFGTNLLVGDYVSSNIFSKIVDSAKGIKRLAVIRADVDNLGQSFVNGFKQTGNGEYETIIRTSIFSRKLSEFFKFHINHILYNPEFSIVDDEQKAPRNAAIVYSGGDDLFVVGSWDDIIGFSVDLNNSLSRFVQGTITLSAGIGIYPDKYPLASMAEQTGELESVSKGNDGKNAVTLFDDSGTYHWNEFVECVISEKMNALREFIDCHDSKGKSMLYNMLELIKQKNDGERLNIARFAYLLARNRPTYDDDKLKKHMELEHKLYNWIQNDKDRRELITAIYIYVYVNRGNDNNEN